MAYSPVDRARYDELRIWLTRISQEKHGLGDVFALVQAFVDGERETIRPRIPTAGEVMRDRFLRVSRAPLARR